MRRLSAILTRLADCGERDPRVLEFDHRDRFAKIESVTLMALRGYAWATIEAEIAKCDVRCAKCHRRRAAVQFSWRQLEVDLAGLEPAT